MSLNWDDVTNSWSYTRNLSGKTKSKGFYEAVNDDIVARLPEDPFGMKIRAAITGWFQDFENDFRMFGIQDNERKKIAGRQYLFKDLSVQPEEERISGCYGFSSSSLEDVDKTICDQSSFFKGVNWVWNNFEINKIWDSDDFNGRGIDNGDSLKGGVICDGSDV